MTMTSTTAAKKHLQNTTHAKATIRIACREIGVDQCMHRHENVAEGLTLRNVSICNVNIDVGFALKRSKVSK